MDGPVPNIEDKVKLLACPSCWRAMEGVSAVARFCPTCGAQLPARDAEGFLVPPPEESPLYPVFSSLREEISAKLADEAIRPQEASSLIILAYANALLNLGWKYEHGRGFNRNVEEASRCYAKAERLSEAWDRK